MILEIQGRKYELVFKDDCIEFCEIKFVEDKDNPGKTKEKKGKAEYFTSLDTVYKRVLLMSLAKKNARIKSFDDVLDIISKTSEEFRKIMKL